MIRVFAPLLSTLVLAGCMSQPPAPTVNRSTAAARPAAPAATTGPGYHTVKRGDTLYRIALENGQDYRDVAAWNNITNPATIREGQVLRVAPPGATPAADTGGVVAQPVITAPAVEARPLDAPKSARRAGNARRGRRGGGQARAARRQGTLFRRSLCEAEPCRRDGAQTGACRGQPETRAENGTAAEARSAAGSQA